MKTNVFIWIVLFILFFVIIYYLPKDYDSSNSSSQNKVIKSTKSRNLKRNNKLTGNKKANKANKENNPIPFELKSTRSKDPKTSNNDEFNSTTQPEPYSNIYNQLKGKTIDNSLKILYQKSRIAQKIIPDFPSFPKYWIDIPKTRGEYASIAERYCVEFLELLFTGHKFVKIRPDWMRNPKTNRCLELDGYCENLKIAVEYNGIQHYVWPNFTNCSLEEFLDQQARDQVKVKICMEKNICLIRIPYTVPYKRIPLAIYSKLLDGVPGLESTYYE